MSQKTPIEKAIQMYLNDIKDCEKRISNLQSKNRELQEEENGIQEQIVQNAAFIKESLEVILKAKGAIEALEVVKTQV